MRELGLESASLSPLSHSPPPPATRLSACLRSSLRKRSPSPELEIVSFKRACRDAKPVSKTASSATHTIDIKTKGKRKIRLHPTVAYDTFWKWCSERLKIDAKRRAGLPAPWTDDPILQQYSFCNVYRVTDRVSQFIVTEVIEKGSQDPHEVVFRVVLFSTFSRISTWEELESQLGPLTWKTYNRNKYAKVLRQIMNRGDAIYTPAFQKPPPKLDHTSAYMNHLELMEIMLSEGLVEKLQNAKYMADVYEAICRYPSMSDFTAFQLLLNLSYTDVLNFSGMDFVVAGLGCESGLVKLFGSDFKEKKLEDRELDVKVIRWMAKNQQKEFGRLGLEFDGLGPDHLPMDLSDIEHAICEVDKYCRKAHPEVEGTKNRRGIRNTFRSCGRPYPKEHAIPKAWARRERLKPAIRRGLPDPEKAYIVQALLKHREGPYGQRQYFVKWKGYPLLSSNTWEPRDMLMEDIPDLVEEYDTRHNL